MALEIHKLNNQQMTHDISAIFNLIFNSLASKYSN